MLVLLASLQSPRLRFFCFFFQAEDGIRDVAVTGVQTCVLPISLDDLDDGAGDDPVLLLALLDRAPGALVLRPLLRQDQPALLVLLLEDQGLDVVTRSEERRVGKEGRSRWSAGH